MNAIRTPSWAALCKVCTIICLLFTTASAGAASGHRDVDEFTRVKYSLPYSVDFVPSDSPYVALQGDEDAIEDIVTDVRNRELRIYEDRSWFPWGGRSKDDVLITVGYVALDGISMTGSGDGYAAELEGDEFKLSLSGSGSMEAETISANDLNLLLTGSGMIRLHDLQVDTVQTRLTGSGDVMLGGSTNTQSLTITGSGNILARELRSQETRVNIQGSGDAQVWTQLSLEARILGSGNVSYRGDPEIEKSTTGSGRVSRIGPGR